MKLKLAMLAGVAVAMSATAAHAADTAQAQFNLSAEAPDTCYILSITANTVPADATFTGPQASGASVSGELNFGTVLADPTTAKAVASTTDLSINAYCNYATHSVKMSSANGGLVTDNTSASVGTFHRRISYTADLTWNGLADQLVATADKTTRTATPLESDGENLALAVNGTANLVINTDADTVPLLQGAYSDTLTITFGPQI
ncbi:MAG: hypothetical protein GC147_12810 [Porphyrobacter sp.]|nr:hypothetical protein [Porphyrobacter sp.]